MKKRIVILAGVIILSLCFTVFAAFRVQAVGTEPGSTSDPLVTKSYVEDIINKKMDLKVVELKPGQLLEGKAGAEFIYRGGGKAQVSISPSAQGGLSDVTGGKDLTNGTPVPLNHLLVIARSDGRGIKALDKNIWVMVKGEYEIK